MARIWLIKTGEPLPIDGPGQRLLRTGLLAKTLVARGHEVVWWSSTFNHAQKIHRYNENSFFNLSSNYSLALIHSPGYKKNTSLGRIIDHFLASKRFSKSVRTKKRPDLILSSFPTPDLCMAAARYCHEHKLPLALDIRDLWPDDLYRLLPAQLSLLGKIALAPMQKSTRAACKSASAILGTNAEFVKWGLKCARREKDTFDRDFPLGYPECIVGKDDLEEANRYWQGQLGNRASDGLIVCFFGTLGVNVDIDTIIRSARVLKQQARRFKFVICGSGDRLSAYRKSSRDLDNIIFPGWVSGVQIVSLMRLSQIGLAPYQSIHSFMSNLPNKSIEYFSGRLAVVSSLKGNLQNTLDKNKCGLTYEYDSVDGLISALIDLYDNREKLEEFRSNAFKLFNESFRAENVYAEMSAHLEFIIQKRGLHDIDVN